MDKDYLLLSAALSRPTGEWKDDDFDVLDAAPVGSPWIWTLMFPPTAGLSGHPRSCDGGIRQVLA
jgi:hypothetical protein